LNAPETAPDQLDPRVRALFASLEHAGEPRIWQADHSAGRPQRILSGEAGREELGTRVRFMLRIDAHSVLEARYRAYGCPHTLATCEWLARQLEGRRLEPAGHQASFHGLAPGTPLDWAALLGVPPVKLGRLLVVEDALRAALAIM
jgi:NifU-like protein involved in Fe-S cluster formation